MANKTVISTEDVQKRRVIKRQVIFIFQTDDPIDRGLEEHLDGLTESGALHEYVRAAVKSFYILGLQLRDKTDA